MDGSSHLLIFSPLIGLVLVCAVLLIRGPLGLFFFLIKFTLCRETIEKVFYDRWCRYFRFVSFYKFFAKLFFLNKKAPISTSMNRKFFHLTRSNPGNGTSFHKYEFAARLRISLFQAIGVRHDDDSFKCYSTLIDFPENVFFEGNKKFPKKLNHRKSCLGSSISLYFCPSLLFYVQSFAILPKYL